MYSQSLFIVLLIFILITIRSTAPSCVVAPSSSSSSSNVRYISGRFHDSYRRVMQPKIYIECENETLSANFHVKVDKLMNTSVEWLEINNANSLEIASGAFNGDLGSLADLRINGINVQVIEPGAFEGLTYLKKLSLKNNRINTLPQYCFGNLTNLTTLDLSFNNILSIHEDTFTGLTKLESLFLQNNNIQTIPTNLFSGLTKLITLDISYNEIYNINKDIIKNLTNLRDFWINDNRMINIVFEDTFVKAPQLTNLYINNNHIEYLNNISLPRRIKIFNVSDNQIKSLNFITFTEINTLDLSSNILLRLKNNTFANCAIKELYLTKNYLGPKMFVEEAFSNLTNLETLSLENNRINQIIGSLSISNKNLKILNLSQNSLRDLSLIKFPNSLLYLNLSSNLFDSIPKINAQKQILRLDLNQNYLKQIEFHSLENFTMLTSLYLRNNQISDIKLGCFRNLHLLTNLDLAYNNISDLQIGVFLGLNSLVSLDLSFNKLHNIQEGIFHNLRLLRKVNLSYNNLNYAGTKNMFMHMWQKEINLQGNNFSCRALTEFMKENKATLTEGNDHNVTNVFGIACKNVDTEIQANSSTTTKIIESSSYKTSNFLLTLILIVLLSKLAIKVFQMMKSTKYFRRKSQQELQLIENSYS